MELHSATYAEDAFTIVEKIPIGTSPTKKRKILEDRVVENAQDRGVDLKNAKLKTFHGTSFTSVDTPLVDLFNSFNKRLDTVEKESAEDKQIRSKNAATIQKLRADVRDLKASNMQLLAEKAKDAQTLKQQRKELKEVSMRLEETQGYVTAYFTVFKAGFGNGILRCFREHMRGKVADKKKLTGAKKRDALMHWGRFWESLGHKFQLEVREELGEDIYCLILTEAADNEDMEGGNENVHSIDEAASVAVQSAYLDIIASALTPSVRIGAEKAFCLIFGYKDIKDAREKIIAALSMR